MNLHDQIDKKLKGRLDAQLLSRRDRGDTLNDIQFWLRAEHGEKVSLEIIRQWCQLAYARSE